jgi:hypothetical protein
MAKSFLGGTRILQKLVTPISLYKWFPGIPWIWSKSVLYTSVIENQLNNGFTQPTDAYTVQHLYLKGEKEIG